MSPFREDCGPVIARLFHPEREQWGRDPWVGLCQGCLDEYFDGCDAGDYREPSAIIFRIGDAV